MNRRILLQNLIEEIRHVFKAIAFSNTFDFGKLKLSRPQIGIILIVAKNKEGITVKDLAQTFGVTSGAITQFVDHLVEKNLVIREEDPNDRRSLKIKLSVSGENRLKKLKKNYFASISPMFDSLNNEEIKQLNLLLSKIVSEKQEGI